MESPQRASIDLQERIGAIFSEAKKRNPAGYATPPSAKKTFSVYQPFRTASGQDIEFHNGELKDSKSVPCTNN